LNLSTVHEFGAFRLEVGERRLLCEGRPIPLRTKVFDTLRVLVEHPGRLLTKDELMHTIWPDTVVEENNLNHNISVLRRALGERATGQSYIETIPRVGYRFVGDVKSVGSPTSFNTGTHAVPPVPTLRQTIRFSTATDGTRIAYSTVGSGPPFVKAANWLNHLEYEWESPVWKHWVNEIAMRHMFVRYDERGCGLSDWNVPEFSFEAWVRDQETVVDALGLDTFALLGISQGGAVAAAYAAQHPKRVSKLILYGAYSRGWRYRDDPKEIEARSAIAQLVRLGWGKSNPTFRHLFTTHFIPEAGPDEMEWFDDLQRISASPENAARFIEEFSRIDVRSVLERISVPTLVLHCQGDPAVPFDEGRRLAASIKGAKFVSLPSNNHLLLANEPAWTIFLREVGEFLGWPQA
jgi:pimeloyl-ACP methyl ester carboxylesterase/DNA-binding winged helix-turn-helix (wHTH) protein